MPSCIRGGCTTRSRGLAIGQCRFYSSTSFRHVNRWPADGRMRKRFPWRKTQRMIDRQANPEAILAPKPAEEAGSRRRIRWVNYSIAVAVVAACTLLSWISQHVFNWPEANGVMILLAGIALVATRWGRGPAAGFRVVKRLDLRLSVRSALLHLSGQRYAVFHHVRRHAGNWPIDQRWRPGNELNCRFRKSKSGDTAKLFRLTRQLSQLSGTDFLLHTAGQQLKEFFGGENVVYLRKLNGDTGFAAGPKHIDRRQSLQRICRAGQPSTIVRRGRRPTRCPRYRRYLCRWWARSAQSARWASAPINRWCSTIPNNAACWKPAPA